MGKTVGKLFSNIPLIGDVVKGIGDFLAPPKAPNVPKTGKELDEEAAAASESERRRRLQTATSRGPLVADALMTNTAKTKLGGSS